MTLSPINLCLLGVIALFGIGLYGLLISRNLIKIVILLQILVKAAILALVSAGSAIGQVNLSQSLGITVIVADTVIAVIGMALAMQARRLVGTLDVRDLSSMKG